MCLSAEGKEALIPQTLTYMLLKSLHETAKAVDVKRVYNFRNGLRVLDLQDERCALPS